METSAFDFIGSLIRWIHFHFKFQASQYEMVMQRYFFMLLLGTS